jgi:pimeloyl-ACP methyl ester carboxylesterase
MNHKGHEDREGRRCRTQASVVGICFMASMVISLFGLLLTGTYAISAHETGDIVAEAAVEPRESDNFYEARSRVWISDQTSRVRGILVLLRGTDSDARGQVSKEDWQQLARLEGLALLGCYFRGDGEPYEDASQGSGEALLRMVDHFAEVTGHQELKDAPLLFIGHSAGAMFAYNFACWRPEKTAAFVSVKTGPIAPTENGRASRVPGLFILGEHDLPGRNRSALDAFGARNSNGSRWALAVEPGKGHEWTPADSELIRMYLSEILAYQKGRRIETTDSWEDLRALRRSAMERRSLVAGLLSSGWMAQKPLSLQNVGFRPWATGGAPLLESLESNPGHLRSLRRPSLTDRANEEARDLVWLPTLRSVQAWKDFTMASSVDALIRDSQRDDPAPLTFSPSALDMGKVDIREPSNSEIEKIVNFKIHGDEPIDCKFVPDSSELSVSSEKMADAEYKLVVRLRTTDLKSGWYRGSIRVGVDNAGSERLSLPVSARIVSSLSPTPPSVYLGVLSRDQVVEQAVSIKSEDGMPFAISNIRSSKPEFAELLSQETKDDSTTLVFRFDGNKALGNQSGHFEISYSEGGKLRKMRIPFIAWVSKRHSTADYADSTDKDQ